ncbi:MAG: hypothetical protein IPL61_39615 [Myxococcales bacterium]|nr:hypothetical protein [Myxococcales bacterium]
MRGALLLLAASLGCSGILDEDEASSNPLLDEVVPPLCADPVAGGDGHHRPGEDCLSCHRQGGDATPYSIAGTLYADVGGTAPAVGITVHVLDATGADVAMVSADNGNFWSIDPIAAPAVAFSARCPDVIPMQASLGADHVGCNQAGCHTAGFRIHP